MTDLFGKKNTSCPENASLFHSYTLYAFFITFIYWTYLLFFSRMSSGGDAICYEHLGRQIYQNGWIEYFRQGPQREPFYPFLVSLTLHLGTILNISYQFVLTLFHILIALISQILLLRILIKLKIHPLITALTILYFGISPAIVNSIFSLYSEIATYPLTLSIILISTQTWQELTSANKQNVLLKGMLCGGCFTLLTLLKGIFELITPLFLLPFFLLLLYSLFKKHKILIQKNFIFIAGFLIIFCGIIVGYKSLNYKYNGHFMLTDRGPWALYGNTARRMEKMTFQRFITAIAFIPGEGLCYSLFGEEACSFWTAHQSDDYGMTKFLELSSSTLPKDQIDKKIGFVHYPGWLNHLYDITLLKNGLRLFFAMLTFFSFILTFLCALNPHKYNSCKTKNIEQIKIQRLFCFFIFTFIILYIGTHSFFYIITRYAFPIVPIFLISIALSLQYFYKLIPRN